jgi:hypothetical protein
MRDLGTLAMPRGCTLDLPVLKAAVEGDQVRLSLAPGAPQDLAIAYTTWPEAGSLFAHGIVSDHAAPRDITWFPSSPPPMLAAAHGKWLALVDAPAETGRHQVLLAHENGADELLAFGDELRSVDVSCVDAACVALTTRVGAVASPGATLFSGTIDAPASAWTRTDIPSDQRGARPLSIASFDPSTGESAVTLIAGPKAMLVRCRDGQARVDGSLDTHHGAMDGAIIGGRFVLASVGAPIDERGCTPEGARIVLQAQGAEARWLNVSAPPRGAVLRSLAKGGVLAWIAPVNCLHPDRYVAYLLVIDESGSPVGSPMAVADARGFALSTRGQEVDMALDAPEGVIRIRAQCAP